jgi:plastocyanin
MTRGITALMTCSALMLASGCGESSEPPKHPVRAAETSAGTGPSREYVPGPTVPAALPPGGVSVVIRNIKFLPESLTVKAGSTVVWTNRDSIEHTVTSVSGPSSFSSRTIADGQSFQVKLTRPGLYQYRCNIHRQMLGTIDVLR